MNSSCERGRLPKAVLATAVCGCFAVLLFASGCNRVAPVDTKAAEQAVRDADTQWSKAAAARDLTTVLAYYTDDAVVMPPNDAMIMDKPSLRKAWTAMLVPGTEISWIAGKVVAASSGDMVFDVGTYTQITRHGKGLPVTDRGKYLAVWKKQADGRWKAIADTWNSDLPAKKAR